MSSDDLTTMSTPKKTKTNSKRPSLSLSALLTSSILDGFHFPLPPSSPAPAPAPASATASASGPTPEPQPPSPHFSDSWYTCSSSSSAQSPIPTKPPRTTTYSFFPSTRSTPSIRRSPTNPLPQQTEQLARTHVRNRNRATTLKLHYEAPQLTRLAQEIRDATIADTELALFTSWMLSRKANFEQAKKYVRELNLDQGYTLARITNPHLRQLLLDTLEHRPLDPREARSVGASSRDNTDKLSHIQVASKYTKVLGEKPQLSPEFQLKKVRSLAALGARETELPLSLQARRNRVMMDLSRAVSYASLTENSRELPPNTPDRPAPLKVRSSSSNLNLLTNGSSKSNLAILSNDSSSSNLAVVSNGSTQSLRTPLSNINVCSGNSMSPLTPITPASPVDRRTAAGPDTPTRYRGTKPKSSMASLRLASTLSVIRESDPPPMPPIPPNFLAEVKGPAATLKPDLATVKSPVVEKSLVAEKSLTVEDKLPVEEKSPIVVIKQPELVPAANGSDSSHSSWTDTSESPRHSLLVAANPNTCSDAFDLEYAYRYCNTPTTPDTADNSPYSFYDDIIGDDAMYYYASAPTPAREDALTSLRAAIKTAVALPTTMHAPAYIVGGFRSVAKEHVLSCVEKTRAWAETLELTVWDNLPPLHKSWRKDEQWLLVALLGCAEFELSVDDIKNVCAISVGIARAPWLREVVSSAPTKEADKSSGRDGFHRMSNKENDVIAK